MICPEDVFYIGRISKFRGIEGEIELLFTDDAFDRGTAEYLIIDMDGILVPFFWEEYRFKNDQTAIIKFEDIDSDFFAKRLVGHSVFYPKKCLPEEENHSIRSWKAFTGFTVTDEKGIILGIVENVDDSSANIIFYLRSPDGKELIIPFHDDFLTDYSLNKRTISLLLSDGLLDIN